MSERYNGDIKATTTMVVFNKRLNETVTVPRTWIRIGNLVNDDKPGFAVLVDEFFRTRLSEHNEIEQPLVDADYPVIPSENDFRGGPEARLERSGWKLISYNVELLKQLES